MPTCLDIVLHRSHCLRPEFGKIHLDAALGSCVTPRSSAANTQENTMNVTAKKLVVAAAVATLTLLGAAAPVSAAKVEAKTVWCC